MSNFHNSFNSLLQKFRAKPSQEFNLLILGLNNAGKSTLAARLCMDTEDTLMRITPTAEGNERHLQLKKIRICMRDLSGQWRMRQSWHTFYQGTNVLIYVIDSADASRLSEARCELCDVLLDERMLHVPLLVLANKQDAAGALPSSMVAELLGLKRLEGRIWKIQDCTTSTGDGINSVLDWIYKNLKQLQSPNRIGKLWNPMSFFGATCLLNCRRNEMNFL